ncbi:hypothetical protein NP493_382g01011 [Ridgeia piscesae]|uniref:Uncharacterized protein n=1 Tax=Ridgeia piscesae TaxID=27915 RepID=A0AAD9L1Q9_RIDPI|nr:hypothetical protein NP493_382g01011 [Ridgeia piscesae]
MSQGGHNIPHYIPLHVHTLTQRNTTLGTQPHIDLSNACIATCCQTERFHKRLSTAVRHRQRKLDTLHGTNRTHYLTKTPTQISTKLHVSAARTTPIQLNAISIIKRHCRKDQTHAHCLGRD